MKKKLLLLILFFNTVLLFSSPLESVSASDLDNRMMLFVLQISVLLVVSKLTGFLFSKLLAMPASLGELLAGLLIGPYAFGAFQLPLVKSALFPEHIYATSAIIPVSPELYGLVVIASIIMLFIAGLESDLYSFVRFSGRGAATGVGGALFSFVLGDLAAVYFLPNIHGFIDPLALFSGAILAGSSIGIAAKLISRKKRMTSPEGSAILAGSVFDNLIAVLLLAIVVAATRAQSNDWLTIGITVAKTAGFWIVCAGLGFMVAPYLLKRIKFLKSIEIISGFSFGLALIFAGLTEMAGFTMIIGAYIAGLALSQTEVSMVLREKLLGVKEFFSPIFFGVMGMMVDVRHVQTFIGLSLLLVAAGIIGKLIGSGLPALLGGFNLKGAFRISSGMMTRGEFSLIVAALGLTAGVLDKTFFSAVVLAVIIINITATPLVLLSLKGGSGIRKKYRTDQAQLPSKTLELNLGSVRLADFIKREILAGFKEENFFVQKIECEAPFHSMRNDHINVTMAQEGEKLVLTSAPEYEYFVRLLVVEEMLKLKDLFQGLESMKSPEKMGEELVLEMFKSE